MLLPHFSSTLAKQSVDASRAQMSARRRLDAAMAREEQRKSTARASALAMVARGLGPLNERNLEGLPSSRSERQINAMGHAANVNAAPSVLILTIDLGGGETRELEVREGDSPAALAARFCQLHGYMTARGGRSPQADLAEFIREQIADTHGTNAWSCVGDAAAESTSAPNAMQEAAWDAAVAAAEQRRWR